jgi:heat shock protein HslJ
MAAAGFKATFLTALLAGCTSVATTNASLEGTEWQVTAIDGQATPRTETYRVQFENGRAGGRFGCNHFGGQFTASGSTLTVSNSASTLMGCPEPAATFEREGLAVLQQPMTMSWASDQQLTLTNDAGSIALERLP